MSGRHTLAEVEQLVGAGELDPDDIHLPGVFVDEVLLKSELSPRKPASRVMNRQLTRPRSAARPGRHRSSGWPRICATASSSTWGSASRWLIPRYIAPDVEVILHAENGVLGLGPLAAPGHEDPDLTNAGKQPATLITGAAIVDSAMSFAVVRGGHLDVTVLGALQVSAHGDLANWYVPGRNPAVGGAMDLVAGAREVWVVMEHVDRAGQPKIVGQCTFR